MVGRKLLDRKAEVCIHHIKLKTLPTEEEVLRVKQELNFLLWTRGDVPELPAGFTGLVRSLEPPEKTKINLQCTAHTTVTAGILARRGFSVTTRAGMAFLLDPSPGQNPEEDHLHQIARHWWLSVDGHGLVDLSLAAEREDPLIYCNRSAGGRWKVAYGDDQQKLAPFLNERQRGCFYLTANKKRVSQADLDQSLGQLFTPAKTHGIALPYPLGNAGGDGEGNEIFQNCLSGGNRRAVEIIQNVVGKRARRVRIAIPVIRWPSPAPQRSKR